MVIVIPLDVSLIKSGDQERSCECAIKDTNRVTRVKIFFIEAIVFFVDRKNAGANMCIFYTIAKINLTLLKITSLFYQILR
jgi:hypothetical protein